MKHRGIAVGVALVVGLTGCSDAPDAPDPSAIPPVTNSSSGPPNGAPTTTTTVSAGQGGETAPGMPTAGQPGASPASTPAAAPTPGGAATPTGAPAPGAPPLTTGPADPVRPTPAPGTKPTATAYTLDGEEQDSRLADLAGRLTSAPGVTLDARVRPRMDGPLACARGAMRVTDATTAAGYVDITFEVCDAGPGAPVDVALSGYDPAPVRYREREVNTIAVGRRFAARRASPQIYGEVSPRESAGDTHIVVRAVTEALGWELRPVVFGTDRGGMDALFYRYHYPEDTAGAVVVAAGLNVGNDRRPYAEFLQRGGDAPACFARLRAVQADMLKRRSVFLAPYLAGESAQWAEAFPDDTLSYEAYVAHLGFLFSRTWHDTEMACQQVPQPGGKPTDMLRSLAGLNGSRIQWEYSWVVLDATYLGWAQYFPVDDGLRRLMRNPGLVDRMVNVSEARLPAYDRRPVDELWAWLTASATNVVFVDSANDLLLAQRPPADPQRGVLQFVAPKRGHLGLDTMAKADGERIWALVDGWQQG